MTFCSFQPSRSASSVKFSGVAGNSCSQYTPRPHVPILHWWAAQISSIMSLHLRWLFVQPTGDDVRMSSFHMTLLLAEAADSEHKQAWRTNKNTARRWRQFSTRREVPPGIKHIEARMQSVCEGIIWSIEAQAFRELRNMQLSVIRLKRGHFWRNKRHGMWQHMQ